MWANPQEIPRIWSHLLKKSLMSHLTFCAVSIMKVTINLTTICFYILDLKDGPFYENYDMWYDGHNTIWQLFKFYKIKQ